MTAYLRGVDVVAGCWSMILDYESALYFASRRGLTCGALT